MTNEMRTSFGLLVLAAPLAAQAPRQFTAEDYARAERNLGAATNPLVSGMVSTRTWLPDGRLWYATSTMSGNAFYMVDPVKRTRATVFDQPRLATALASIAGDRVDPNRLPFTTFTLSKDGREITFLLGGGGGFGGGAPAAGARRVKCDIQTYQCAQLDTNRVAGAPMAAPRNSSVSPDGNRAVFIKDNNLWLKDLLNGRETQLTTDGIKDFGYATDNAGWTKSDRPVVSWSPDSKKIATFQHDGRGTSDMYLVTTNVGAPKLSAWKYPLPGDSVIFRISRVVIDLDATGGPKLVRFQMPPDQHRSTVSDHIACGTEICDVQWYPDASHVAFISSSRDHKEAWMRVANASTGEVRTLFKEESATQVGDASLPENLWKVLPASNELIWWSQKQNWIHLYLFDLTTGKLKNQIVSGDGNVMELTRVDEKARTIWFVGQGKEAGRDPYFRHFYSIGFDGKNQKLLTPENANHSVTLSDGGKYFVDSYSTPTTPPVTVLRDANGRMVLELERADITRLTATGWRPPTPVTMKARDGKTDIYGLMFTPSRLDSAKKYPIINYIYPGPQSGSVGSRSFAASRSDHQALAELGFVVVAIDGMGTPGRSKSFHDAYYGDMGDNTLPDQVAGMKQLAQRYSWIDIDRVGIWGHSGGGFATAGAMFRFPDFFDVGISESGNHDNRNYEDDWGERYQGLLQRRANGPDNYADEANQTHARNLKGKLMLVHGGMDNNVPPYNTYLVAEALARANKDFDLLVFPNAAHGFGQFSNYMMRRRWDYFVKNLLGAEPPKEYQIGRPPVVP
jgi:dipeptidyl-peptidase 4